jgi:hypothetical protein
MQFETTWGNELNKLDHIGWGWLESPEMKRLVALEGNLASFPSDIILPKLKDAYRCSRILNEAPGNYNFNTSFCLYQISLFMVMFKMERYTRPFSNVIELGAGIGNFSRIFRQFIEVDNYTILDIPTMSRFSSRFLDAHNLETEFVDSRNIETLKGRRFDLFISNICMSEIEQTWRQAIIDTLWPNCFSLYCIDGDSNNTEFDKWLIGEVGNKFDMVHAEPFTQKLWKGQKIYYGQKL